MGKNLYPNGYIQDTPGAWVRLGNAEPVQLKLRLLGEEAIAVAISLYEFLSKHDDTAPVFYASSFGVRETHYLLARAIEVYNDDPTAEWVEFGAHAGGRTPVLRYRILGKTFDIMASRAEL